VVASEHLESLTERGGDRQMHLAAFVTPPEAAYASKKYGLIRPSPANNRLQKHHQALAFNNWKSLSSPGLLENISLKHLAKAPVNASFLTSSLDQSDNQPLIVQNFPLRRMKRV
jgi:hypothetical protein